jgi:hypothetical protein
MAVLKLKNEETGEFESLEIISGPQGPQGIPGEEGYTPQKGIDYFTEEEIQEIVDSIVDTLPEAEGVEF